MSFYSKSVILIMGRPHSGSTIFAMHIAEHLEGIAVGELHRLFYENNLCACGLMSQDCSFWKSVISEYNARSNSNFSDFSQLVRQLRKPRNYYLFFHTKSVKTYAKNFDILYECILHVSGKCVVVDSSRSPFHNLALLLNSNQCFTIEILRSPFASVKPKINRTDAGEDLEFLNFKIKTPHKTVTTIFFSLNLLIGSIISLYVRLRFKRHTDLVTYEFFLKNFSVYLKKLISKIEWKDKSHCNL